MPGARELRVGWIRFANMMPLHPALARVPEISIETGVPTSLNAKLAAGEIDLAAISSVEYARNAERYVLLPGLSISSDGPTRSVLVASQVPVEEAGPGPAPVIHLTPHSATSVVLLKVLATFAWPARGLEFTTDPASATARLLIGDEALRELLDPVYPHHTDLGLAWQRHTGLPMVFALFCARREVLTDHRRGSLLALHAALAAMAREPDRAGAAAEAASRLGLPEPRIREYLDGLDWILSPRQERGLSAFLDLAARIGEAPATTSDRTAVLEA